MKKIYIVIYIITEKGFTGMKYMLDRVHFLCSPYNTSLMGKDGIFMKLQNFLNQ